MKSKVHPSILCLFCEDVRAEKSDTATIVGVFPDNIAVPSLPGAFGKLSLYVRGAFPLDKRPASFSVRLEFPWEPKVLNIGEVAADTIGTSFKQAKEQGNDAAGLIVWATLTGFPIRQAGRIKAIATIGKADWKIGSLNIVAAKTTEGARKPQQVRQKLERTKPKRTRR
jgi:hypothetical protein